MAEDQRRGSRPLRRGLTAVINATGVIIHTNLGRGPLSAAALQNISAVSTQYTNLEYDLKIGARSHRDLIIEPVLRELLGCESAAVVNNNAAAVFLILNSLAAGREVVVSRGELIEIGGSFRIPEIMACSGARLCEVGSANKTYLSDYEAAIGPQTALLLRVHPSNYRVRGSTAKPGLPELADLARRRGLPLVEDIGSGCLVDLRTIGIDDEPRAQDSIAAGVDLACFSADKLMGGPQAGIIAGSRRLVEIIRKNPLMRTYRVDKLVYGALEATLDEYRANTAWQKIPILHMLSISKQELTDRSNRFIDLLGPKIPGSVHIGLREGSSLPGGGSCPDIRIPTVLVVLVSDRNSPNEIERRLRVQSPPVLVRLEDDAVLIDLRTVFPSQEPGLTDALATAVS